jgi:hypothetical protein
MGTQAEHGELVVEEVREGTEVRLPSLKPGLPRRVPAEGRAVDPEDLLEVPALVQQPGLVSRPELL